MFDRPEGKAAEETARPKDKAASPKAESIQNQGGIGRSSDDPPNVMKLGGKSYVMPKSKDNHGKEGKGHKPKKLRKRLVKFGCYSAASVEKLFIAVFMAVLTRRAEPNPNPRKNRNQRCQMMSCWP